MRTMLNLRMKKHILPLACLCCLLITACKKHPMDYRNKFLGDYTFSVHFSRWQMGSGSFDTTYNSNGSVACGNDDHSVAIALTGGPSFDFIIYEDGSLGPAGFSIGEFESVQHVSFVWSSGGLGGGVYYAITGERR